MIGPPPPTDDPQMARWLREAHLLLVKLQQQVLAQKPPGKPSTQYPFAFVAEITGNNGSGLHQWKEKINAGGTFVDYTGGRTCTDFTDVCAATTLDETTNLPAGTMVLMVSRREAAGFRYTIVQMDTGTSAYPFDLTYLDEHAEAVTDPGCDTAWDRASPPADTDGVKLTISVGSAYYHAGDQKLYEFHRDLLFDSAGKLVSMGAAYRVTIDVPEDCAVA